MPRRRLLTREEEAEALAQRRAGITVAGLARMWNLSHNGMKELLARAEREANSIEVSRETSIGAGGCQP